MKFNQFALCQLTIDEKISELETIGFLAHNQKSNFRNFLEKSFPECTSPTSKLEKIKSLQANKSQDLDEYLKENNEEVDTRVFYNVALQLLGFLDIVDFQMDEPFAFMEEANIPFADNHTSFGSSVELYDAWHLLLCTHNKFGLAFVDYLASKGYFKDFPKDKFLLFNGRTLPIFTSSDFVREVVYVETDVDTDKNGLADLVRVEIIRPQTSLKIPALFTASPYHQGINPEANDRKLHEYKLEIKEKEPNELTYEDIRFEGKEEVLAEKRVPTSKADTAEESFSHEQAYTFNDFMLTRGFASVYAAGVGGLGSEGIMTCASVEQTLSMKAVVEWLAGNRRAFTNKTDNIEITADWCNGKVAMTGKSYLGTLATAVATTGVKGLETIISEAAISNWYQYYRDNGLVIAPGGFPGEDADVLAELTLSRMISAGDYLHIKDFFDKEQAKMALEQDREFGNYNTFWDERNYLPHIKDIKADVIMVHGLIDWNVKPRHVEQLWQELKKLDVTKKIILHQGQHIYINNNRSLDFSDMMNLWLTHKLLKVENGAKVLLPDVLWQDNTVSETWVPFSDWSINQDRMTLYPVREKLVSLPIDSGELSFKDYLPEDISQEYSKAQGLFDKEIQQIENEKLKDNRLFFVTEELTEEVLLDGVPSVKIRVKSTSNKGLISVRLVDYGDAKRLDEVPRTLKAQAIDAGYLYKRDDLKELLSTSKETSEKMISIGHINLQNRDNPWKNDELKPDDYVAVEFDLQPTIYRLPKGHKIGLIIYATDYDYTLQGNEKIGYKIDLSQTKLVLPIRE